MSRHVYVAQAMKGNPEAPIHTRKIGVTPEAAKAAVLDVMETKIPAITHNLEWEQDTIHRGEWIFTVRKKEIHQ